MFCRIWGVDNIPSTATITTMFTRSVLNAADSSPGSPALNPVFEGGQHRVSRHRLDTGLPFPWFVNPCIILVPRQETCQVSYQGESGTWRCVAWVSSFPRGSRSSVFTNTAYLVLATYHMHGTISVWLMSLPISGWPSTAHCNQQATWLY